MTNITEYPSEGVSTTSEKLALYLQGATSVFDYVVEQNQQLVTQRCQIPIKPYLDKGYLLIPDNEVQPLLQQADNDNHDVTAALVEENRRLDMLPTYFAGFLTVEQTIFGTLSQLCAEYNGGYWAFYELSNGGFYMALMEDETLNLQNPGNGFSGDMSADAAGIVVCLLVYSNLAFKNNPEEYTQRFYQLRRFALTHAEADVIFAAID